MAQASPCASSVVTSPLAGQGVSGAVRILGSASIDRFRFYKLEWARAEDPETWIATSTVIASPVRHGVLDRWDTTGLAAGAYRLKLTVVDEDSQERCRFVVEPLRFEPADAGADATPSPTAAPLPTARPGDAPARPASPTSDGAGATVAQATEPPTDAAPSAQPSDEPLATATPQPEAPAGGAEDAAPPTTADVGATSEAPLDATVGVGAPPASPDDAAEPPDDSAGAEAVEPPTADGAAPGLVATLGARARSGFLVGFAVVVAIALAAIALRARPARR